MFAASVCGVDGAQVKRLRVLEVSDGQEPRVPTGESPGPRSVPAAESHTPADGLRKLLAANRSILGELSLPSVLTRVVESACELTGAKYGALGVIGADGRLEQFIHVGMDPAQVAAIGELPLGRGLLGTVITHPEPIRLACIADDSRSSGFPANHPPMTSFLGVPIRLREEVYGNLYLTESAAGEFSAQDTELAVSLAGTAATAIENARLFRDAGRRQDWLQASTEITRKLLARNDHDALRDIAELVQSLANADVVTVVLPSDEGSELRIAVATGLGEKELTGLVYPREGTLSQAAIDTGEPIRIARVHDTSNLEVHLTDVVPVGPVIALPLVVSGRPKGALLAGRLHGRPAFSLAELDMAGTFAGHAAIALELADTRAAQDRLALLEERGRIARDLHDHVIQRLFAAGLTVQSVISRPATDSTARLTRVVGEIDETIRQIRTSIFALQGALRGQDTARGQLLATIDGVAISLEQKPRVRFAGPVDTLVSAELIDDVKGVLRESLTNVARHACARTVDIDISVQGDLFSVDVIDDGIGLGTSTRRSGLANLSDRAEHLAGTFLVASTPGNGTHLRWTAPLK